MDATLADFITIAAYDDFTVAERAHFELHAHKIPSNVERDEAVTVEFLASNARGGAVLQIDPKDEERAIEVLSQTPVLSLGIVDSNLTDEELERQAMETEAEPENE